MTVLISKYNLRTLCFSPVFADSPCNYYLFFTPKKVHKKRNAGILKKTPYVYHFNRKMRRCAMEKKRTGITGSRQGTAVMDRKPDMSDQVKRTAYELFQKRGYAHGDDWQDWFEAERMVYSRSKGR
jgi:hypothetical protein